MALINCPECGTEVSDKADKCPRCAHPINYSPPPSAPVAPNVVVNAPVKSEGCFLQTLNVGCIIALIFLIMMVILNFIIFA